MLTISMSNEENHQDPVEKEASTGSSSSSSSSSSTTSSLDSDFMKRDHSHEDTNSANRTGVPLYYKDAEFLEMRKQERRAKKEHRRALRLRKVKAREARKKYIDLVALYVKKRARFARILGRYLGKTIPVEQLRSYLRQFKEILSENDYVVQIDPRRQTYQDRSINIKYIEKEKKKLTLGRRMTVKLGITKDKRRLTDQEKKLLQVITTFDDMYETLNDSLTAWWEYKGYTNNPRGCLLGTQKFNVRRERRWIWLKMYQPVRTPSEKAAMEMRIRRNERRRAEKAAGKRLPDFGLEIRESSGELEISGSEDSYDNDYSNSGSSYDNGYSDYESADEVENKGFKI